MITIEYYWNGEGPKLLPLLVTYTMKGDGTRGTAKLEPFPEEIDESNEHYEGYRHIYGILEGWPEALMYLELDADEAHLAWTKEFAEKKARVYGGPFRVFWAEEGEPLGVGRYRRNMRPPKPFGMVTLGDV